jgi:hypothetical protein
LELQGHGEANKEQDGKHAPAVAQASFSLVENGGELAAKLSRELRPGTEMSPQSDLIEVPIMVAKDQKAVWCLP